MSAYDPKRTCGRELFLCSDWYRFPHSPVLQNAEPVGIYRPRSEAVNLYVPFARELTWIPTDGLPLRLLVCAAKEFDLEQHPITMVSHHARFHPFDVLVLALSEHLDRAFDVCFWDGMIFCGANVRLWKSRPDIVVPLLQRYVKIEDRKVAEDLYAYHVSVFQKVPRPSFPGMQSSAMSLKESDIADSSFIDELERSGFIDRLYAADTK